MPIYLVKQTLAVEVVKLVPAGDEKLAESALLNRFTNLVTDTLIKDNFIVTNPDTLDCVAKDIDKLEE